MFLGGGSTTNQIKHLGRYLILRTDPVVCPDFNIEDSLSSNMRRETAENTAYTPTQCFLLSDSGFSGFSGF